MTAAVIIASILLALWPPAYVACALRWPQAIPLPRYLAGWLEDIPWPRILDKLTIPLRLRRATGQHAAPLELRRSRTGLLRRAEDPTGDFPALDDTMFSTPRLAITAGTEPVS